VVGGADAALKVNAASSSLRDRPHNEHDISSAETDKLQRANQTEPVINTNISNGAPQTLGEGDPAMVDISNFTAAKILDERPSPSGVEYRCELEPL
jgi:hypothetical protein